MLLHTTIIIINVCISVHPPHCQHQDTGENEASEENQGLSTAKLNGTEKAFEIENGNPPDSQRKYQEQAKEMVNDELNINKNQVIVVNSNCGLQALWSWKDQDSGENGASDNREQMKPVLARRAVASIPTQIVLSRDGML